MSPHPLRLGRRAPACSAVTLALALTTAWGQTPALDPSRSVPHHKAEKVVADLAAAPEVSLQARGETTILYKTHPGDGADEHPVLEEFDRRADLAGMPVQRGDACRASPAEAARIGEHSRELRQTFARLFDPNGGAKSRREATNTAKRYYHDTDVGLTLQMLQCEGEPARKYLHERLRDIGTPAASKALAQRAVYETDPDLRRAAVRALKAKPSAAAKQVLLDGFRHPYPAFADFASEALVALGAKEVKAALVDLLDMPNPHFAQADRDAKPVVREIVRVNHARNCQLCHAPSWGNKDVARVGVPLQNQPLPEAFSVEYYNPGGDRAFVTAGVTYLRQDFSLTLPVADAAPWPAKQRFDFFVRDRPAEDWEVAAAGEKKPFPQRYAVLRTLRALTGQDFGNRADDWRKGLRGTATSGEKGRG